MKVFLKKKPFEAKIAENNLSHEEVARVLGIKISTLSTLKYPGIYNRGLSPKRREKLQKLLKVDFGDLFFVRSACYKQAQISKKLKGSNHKAEKASPRG